MEIPMNDTKDFRQQNEECLREFLTQIRDLSRTEETDPDFCRKVLAVIETVQEKGGKIDSALWTRFR
jgi:hypothetical protein